MLLFGLVTLVFTLLIRIAEGASPRQSDRLLVAVFAMIGTAAALFWLIAFVKPMYTVASYDAWPEPRPDATLTVRFFGRFEYMRSAPDSTAFRDELMFWSFALFV